MKVTRNLKPVEMTLCVFFLVLAALELSVVQLDPAGCSGDALGDEAYVPEEVQADVRDNIDILQNEKSIVMRAGAAKALGNIGPDARESAPALADVLSNDTHPMVRVQAAKALGKIGPGVEVSGLALSKALWYDEDVEVRKTAVRSLGQIRDNSKATLKVLAAVIKFKDPEVGLEAVKVLVKIDPNPKTAVYYLSDTLLNAETPLLRVTAAQLLGQIGPNARDATPVLAKALEDEDSDVRLYSAEALGKIGREALTAASALSKAARDPDTRVRNMAKKSLMEMARNRR